MSINVSMLRDWTQFEGLSSPLCFPAARLPSHWIWGVMSPSEKCHKTLKYWERKRKLSADQKRSMLHLLLRVCFSRQEGTEFRVFVSEGKTSSSVSAFFRSGRLKLTEFQQLSLSEFGSIVNCMEHEHTCTHTRLWCVCVLVCVWPRISSSDSVQWEDIYALKQTCDGACSSSCRCVRSVSLGDVMELYRDVCFLMVTDFLWSCDLLSEGHQRTDACSVCVWNIFFFFLVLM